MKMFKLDLMIILQVLRMLLVIKLLLFLDLDLKTQKMPKMNSKKKLKKVWPSLNKSHKFLKSSTKSMFLTVLLMDLSKCVSLAMSQWSKTLLIKLNNKSNNFLEIRSKFLFLVNQYLELMLIQF